MKFKNNIAKIAVRYVKEIGKYDFFKKLFQSFPEFIKKINENEEEFFKVLPVQTPLFMLYGIGMYLENPYYSNFQMYLFEIYKTEIINLFETFLKTNKLYENFFENVDINFIKMTYQYNKEYNYLEIKNENENKKDTVYKHIVPYSYISHTFRWKKTKQGETVWSEINYKWRTTFIEYVNSL